MPDSLSSFLAFIISILCFISFSLDKIKIYTPVYFVMRFH